MRFRESDSHKPECFFCNQLHHTTKEKMIQFTRELKQHECHGGYNGKHVGDAHVFVWQDGEGQER